MFPTAKWATRALDLITPEAGAVYAMDRGYRDCARLHARHRAGALFVTRAKINMKYRRAASRPVDKSNGLRADQSIARDGFYTRRNYPKHLRRGHFCDPETGKRRALRTNNFTPPAKTIAALHKQRWQAELFFKRLKQHLRIRHFFGPSGNAAKTQIWTAVCVYVLAAIIEKELARDVSLATFLQILSVHSCEKIQLSRAFQDVDGDNNDPSPSNQLNLFPT